MKQAKLKIKYMFGITFLVLFIFTSLLGYVYFKTSQVIESELQRRAISIAHNLAHSAEKPIITENWIELQLMLRDSLKNEENLRYVILIDPDAAPLAHSFGFAVPTELLALNRIPLSEVRPLITTVKLNGEPVAHIGVPIHHGDLGRIYVGLSEASIDKELAAIAVSSVPMVAALLLIGIAFAWWYANRLTTPIAELVAAVEGTGSGDFTARIKLKCNDEIGELAAAFNQMQTSLTQMTTEQQKAENELHLQAQMLEEEVAERQVAQEQLAVKQLQLEEFNQLLEKRIEEAVDELRLKDRVMMLQGRQAAMGEMINNIAHQWRQPINNLGLLIQSMKADYYNNQLTAENLDDSVNKSMSTIFFMSQTINDFSSFFSPDRKKTDFMLFQGLKKVVAMLAATLSTKGINLVVENRDEVMISGFFNEYNQVLLNLINNAKDVLLERNCANPVITVTLYRDGDNALVTVSDNGGGIDETIIDKVFDPFFTTKGQGKGSGIGLYLSTIIITEHFGGTLTVANRDGGAQFTITTPCRQG